MSERSGNGSASMGVAERLRMTGETTDVASYLAAAYVVAVPADHSRGHDFSMASLVVESLADARLYLTLGIG